MLEFGSVVLYKVSAKVQGGVVAPRWLQGLWLGNRWGSEEHIVSTLEGLVIRCCAAKPHPENQWDTALFDGIKGSPWDPLARNKTSAEGETVEQTSDLPRFTVERSVEATIPQARAVMITRDYLNKFGFTTGCTKCEAIRVGDNRNPTLAHSAACRSRIEGLMGNDPLLKRKLPTIDKTST